MINIKSNALILKQIFKPLNAISDEFRLHITSDGLWSSTVNSYNVAMLKLDLPKSVFDSYSVESETQIGIDLKQWNNVFKYSKKIDTYEINIQMDKSAIGEGLQYGKMELLDSDGFQDIISILDVESIRKESKTYIPDSKLTASVTIPTSRFIKLLRKSQYNEKRRDNYIQFEVKNGVLYTRSYNRSESDIGQKNAHFTNGYNDVVVGGEGKAQYLLDELYNISRHITSKTVNIIFGNDYPLKIKWDVLEKGTAEYLLAPRIESE